MIFSFDMSKNKFAKNLQNFSEISSVCCLARSVTKSTSGSGTAEKIMLSGQTSLKPQQNHLM